jgi:hypothetical protein
VDVLKIEPRWDALNPWVEGVAIST